ncbi:MAG: type 1 glutamine amidotransferase [bacterium]|nr:type 1 glutamine amidotransferase [bacterium]
MLFYLRLRPSFFARNVYFGIICLAQGGEAHINAMAPRVAVLLHTETEKPGSLADFLTAHGAEISYIALYAGHPLPPDPRAFDLIVVMGGTMNVYETAAFPFLRDEPDFIARAMAAHIPVLGICLGAQLIALACGVPVIKSPQPEVGWFSVTLTPDATHEPAFSGFPPSFTVLQWHEDMATLPAGAVLLATSQACPHQAYRIGSALALQFHIEMTHPLLQEWTADKPHLQGIADDFAQHGPTLLQLATRLYENLWSRLVTHDHTTEA